ncbi:MAG: NTPase, partial [Bacteroidales bacterium]|nr:NTPase [Bacteroidales bacterium]
MLETISELLVNKAKVILTSRRSAIFDGEMFGEWVEKYTDNFTISRYRLEKPMINDWLTPNRLDLLNSTEIFDISKLANPVLLSFLRFVDDDYFKQLCAQPALIVEKYF